MALIVFFIIIGLYLIFMSMELFMEAEHDTRYIYYGITVAAISSYFLYLSAYLIMNIV